MKNILIGAALSFFVIIIMSLSGADGRSTNGSTKQVYSIPIMQKSVVVTTNKDYMLRLIQKSYIVQDVDVVYDDFHSKCIYSYTLIKY